MFKTIFWILAVWFVINAIWMWFKLDDQKLQKTFAWINVCAIIIGFWAFYGVDHATGGIATWFIVLNWANVVLAILQFYYGFRSSSATAHHPAN